MSQYLDPDVHESILGSDVSPVVQQVRKAHAPYSELHGEKQGGEVVLGMILGAGFSILGHGSFVADIGPRCGVCIHAKRIISTFRSVRSSYIQHPFSV